MQKLNLFVCHNCARSQIQSSIGSRVGKKNYQDCAGAGESRIIRPAHSLYNFPIWPVRKSHGTWRMTVDYRELNKVTPPIHAAVPNIASLMDALSREIETYHCVLDLANAFFSIPIAKESQDKFAFT